MTFKQVCYLLHLEKEKNKQLQAEKEAMHIDLVAAEEYAMRLKLENDKLQKETSKELEAAKEKIENLQAQINMLESERLSVGDTLECGGQTYTVTRILDPICEGGGRAVLLEPPFPTVAVLPAEKKKWWRFWR